MNAVITKHKLDFEMCKNPKYAFPIFRVGTVNGLYYFTQKELVILAINNTVPGNGHFEDTMEWFEYSAKQNNRKLAFQEVWNENFKKHLIEKRGFFEIKPNLLIKSFDHGERQAVIHDFKNFKKRMDQIENE